MAKKNSSDRVSEKVQRMRRNKGMRTNVPQSERGKTTAPRTHKSHIPVMRARPPFRHPKEICEESGHKEFVLAESPTKKIMSCARLCGYYKVYKKAS